MNGQDFNPVIDALLGDDLKTATQYIAPDFVIKASRQHRKTGRDRITTLLITYGKPNYAEKKFIKLCQRAGEPFPVAKIQLTRYPNKRPRKLSMLTQGYGGYTCAPVVVVSPGTTAIATMQAPCKCGSGKLIDSRCCYCQDCQP